jgi:two-component SAPR family response regulator
MMMTTNQDSKYTPAITPLVALSNFKPNFFDLILVDINMSPYIDGFEFCEKILQLDVNVRLCFISAGEVNYAVIREIYPQY